MAEFTPIDIATFWSRVAGSTTFQCWPWRGQKNEGGYGRFRGHMAHRLAYEIVNGPIPDGAIIRHRCDNPECCNPVHLEPGSNADNTHDAIERGRFAKGSRTRKSNLTEDDVRYIRENRDGRKQIELARMFGVTPSTISYIRSGRSWKDGGHDRD